MKISDVAIDRSTTVIVMLVIIAIMGTYSWFALPRESNPEVVIPYVLVMTSYEGVSPEDIESLITVPIENKLSGMSGVKEITSSSVEGTSTIRIEFGADEDIDAALQKVRDKVDQAKGDLPDEADDPVVQEINVSEFPIMLMCITGDLPLPVLTNIAEDLEERIEAVKGVLNVDVVGGVEREIQIEVDPDRVAEYGISFADLINITRLENVNTPGGSMNLGAGKFLMRTPGEFRTPDELNNLVVKQGPTGLVYLRDIAFVRDGYKELESTSRLDGKPSVTLSVSKRSGENIIEIADEVNALVKQELASLPGGIEVALTWDESDWIRDMVAQLENGILSGLVLVIAVIFIFLGFVNAIFVALAIPVSMLITFAVLHMTGVTLNMVVLFSLILALGMLVDNGIVVVENIYRYRQMGMERVEAAKKGTAEVAWPITSSTLTTVAAFAPLFFWPGIWGEFMVYLPETVVIALCGSLFVGLIVNPALAAVFMRRVKADVTHSGAPRRHRFLRFYASVLRTALQWRAVTITLAVTALVVIVGVFAADMKVEFTPEVEPPQAYINIECPEGTNLETSDQYVRRVEEATKPYAANIEHVVANAGSEGVDAGGPSGSANSTHLSRVTLDFPRLDECERLPSEILEELRAQFENVSGAEIRIAQMDMGPPTGPPVNVEISGDDYDVLAKLAEDVQEAIRDVPGLVDLRDDYSRGKPEVRVHVDRQKAWMTGLNTQFVGLTVRAAIDGRKAGEYREGDEEYDVIVKFPKSFAEDLSNLESMNLINLAGQPVPFSSVASIEHGAGLASVRRIDRKRTVTVSAEVEGDLPPPDVLKKVKAIVDEMPLPAGYTVDYTGENEDTEETQLFLRNAFVVAVLLVGLILITQFNSILQPLIILSSVVLSLAGVFLGLLLFDMPFGILMTGIGCISLAGVVVNNAIVLIDFINQLRERGEELTEAIVEASVTRFRPVMLTAVTTILGLVPMAAGITFDFWKFKWVSDSESSQWWGSMAISVSFGLGFATVLTLIVVPVLYSITAGAAATVTGVLPGTDTQEELPAK